jgi:hypothetical protein
MSKKPQTSATEKAWKYMQMMELQKSKNGTISDDPRLKRKRYEKLLRKGTLDQRLQNVINYKKENTLFVSQEEEMFSISDEELALLDSMDDDDDDENLFEDQLYDDEEARYEAEVLKILEQSKLKAVKSGISFGESSYAYYDRNETNVSEDEKPSQVISQNLTQDELYTPKRSSWGVFERPKDISKTYGGGKTLTKEVMEERMRILEEQMDEDRRRREELDRAKFKADKDNQAKLEEALLTAKNYMKVGNRVKAVETLEDAENYIGGRSVTSGTMHYIFMSKILINTSQSGKVLLELAMAYETVKRNDDARKTYGRLTAVGWPDQIRRQSLSLMQGLDIASQISNNLTTSSKPVVDPDLVRTVSESLMKGTENMWVEYKTKKYNKYRPWYDTGGLQKKIDDDVDKVNSFGDAYRVMLLVTNPLKEIPDIQIRRAFRKIFTSSSDDVEDHLSKTGRIKIAKNRDTLSENVASSAAVMSSPSVTSNTRRMTEQDRFSQVFKSLTSDFSKEYPVLRDQGKITNKASSKSEYFYNSLNGTWDIVVSSFDRNNRELKRFQSGDLRRNIYTIKDAGTRFIEKYTVKSTDYVNVECNEVWPLFWSLSYGSHRYPTKWDGNRCELIIKNDDIKKSVAPWIRSENPSRRAEITYQV